MPLTRHSNSLSLFASLAIFLGTAAACTPSDGSEVSPPAESATNSDPTESAMGSAPAEAQAGFTGADEGNGVVWYDGVKHENFRGSCEISRGFGQEDVGDISMPGIVVAVAVDNVDSNPATEMNFVAISESRFTVSGQGLGRLTGTLTGKAYESDLTPKGTSQAMALVAFSGVTKDDVPVVAHVVCEIQNKF